MSHETLKPRAGSQRIRILQQTLMPRISCRDVQCLSIVIQDLYAATDLESFATCAVRGLRQLVPGDRASYHHASPKPHRVTTIAGDGGSALPAGDAIVTRWLHEHYLVRSFDRHDAQRWLRISDVLNRDTFRRSNLYEHYSRHVGIEFQIGVMFRGPQDGFLGMVVNRKTRDFSERDPIRHGSAACMTTPTMTT